MMKYSSRPVIARGMIGPEPEGIEFTPPDGLELRGDKGTAEVQWRRKPDGKICIVSIEGVTLGDGDEGPDMADTDNDQEGGNGASASYGDTDQ